jgi:hypothetical protein
MKSVAKGDLSKMVRNLLDESKGSISDCNSKVKYFQSDFLKNAITILNFVLRVIR